MDQLPKMNLNIAGIYRLYPVAAARLFRLQAVRNMVVDRRDPPYQTYRDPAITSQHHEQLRYRDTLNLFKSNSDPSNWIYKSR